MNARARALTESVSIWVVPRTTACGRYRGERAAQAGRRPYVAGSLARELQANIRKSYFSSIWCYTASDKDRATVVGHDPFARVSGGCSRSIDHLFCYRISSCDPAARGLILFTVFQHDVAIATLTNAVTCIVGSFKRTAVDTTSASRSTVKVTCGPLGSKQKLKYVRISEGEMVRCKTPVDSDGFEKMLSV